MKINGDCPFYGGKRGGVRGEMELERAFQFSNYNQDCYFQYLGYFSESRVRKEKENRVAPLRVVEYHPLTMQTRTREKRQLRMEAGKIKLPLEVAKVVTPDYADKIVDMRERGLCPPDGFRVPVFYRDTAGDWWWMGMRALNFVKGERVSLHGLMVDVEKKYLEFDCGWRRVWMADDSSYGDMMKFQAPHPLDTVEDAEKYFRDGIDGTAKPGYIAAKYKWRGMRARMTADDLRKLVLAVKHGNKPLADTLRKRLESSLVFPGREERVAKMSCEELAAMFARMERELATFREREAAAKLENEKLKARQESTETRLIRMIEAQRKMIETLRAEMSRLADLLI